MINTIIPSFVEDQSAPKRLFELITALSFSLVIASFQAYANDLDLLTSEDASPLIDKPTVIPGVVPKIVDTPIDLTNITFDIENSASPQFENLDQQISTISQSSDLIFRGKVVDVEYQAVKTNTNISYPLTYITLSVFEVIQGHYSDDEIVLMMAGVGHAQRTKIVFSSNSPFFARDDEPIPFLVKSTVKGCKYVRHFSVV